MSGQLDMLGSDAPDEEREREYEVDRTPRGLVRAALEAHLAARPDGARRQAVYVAGHLVWSEIEGGPLRVLDVCAGSGVWASEMRAWCERHGIPVEITAIEIREEERECIKRVADRVYIGDAFEVLCIFAAGAQTVAWAESRVAGPVWHITIGNPAFSLLAMKPGKPSLVPMLARLARAVILLSTTQAFTRSKTAAEWLHDNPPALEVRIAQGVRFRSSSGTDGISYSVTSWVQRHVLPGTPWPCQVLVLPAEARRWREIPGREVEP